MDRVAVSSNSLRDFSSYLAFRVSNDDIIFRREENADDFPLGGEGFSAPRSAQVEAVRVVLSRTVFQLTEILAFSCLCNLVICCIMAFNRQRYVKFRFRVRLDSTARDINKWQVHEYE
jgi:hypothetical protein